MKDSVVLKDDKWIWPIADENSWQGQNEYQNLHEHVLPYVKTKNVMIQAGGNCGFMLSKFVDHFKTVYTFEPDPINFYCLNQNVTQDNVIKMQCCLGSNNEPVKVQQLIRPGRLHDTGGVHIAGAGYTPSITIDSLNLPECDLIQLDIEGFELNALIGGLKTIEKFKPILCIEFCEKWLNRYDSSSEKIENLLNDLGYEHKETCGVDRIYAHKNN
jgi:FkbM family methyltransferase